MSLKTAALSSNKLRVLRFRGRIALIKIVEVSFGIRTGNVNPSRTEREVFHLVFQNPWNPGSRAGDSRRRQLASAVGLRIARLASISAD